MFKANNLVGVYHGSLCVYIQVVLHTAGWRILYYNPQQHSITISIHNVILKKKLLLCCSICISEILKCYTGVQTFVVGKLYNPILASDNIELLIFELHR